MKKNTITGIILLMSISLIGIILVQIFWMKNAIEVKEKQFDQSVNEALTAAVKTLVKKETVSWVSNKILDGHDSAMQIISINDSTVDQDFIFTNDEPGSYTYVSSSGNPAVIDIQENSNKAVTISSSGPNNFKIKTIASLDSIRSNIDHNQYVVLSKFTDSVNVIVDRKISEITNRSKSMNEALNELVYEIKTYDEPVAFFFGMENIQQNIQSNLNDKGIDLIFDFAVYNPDKDSLTEVRSEGFTKSKKGKIYETRLFPESLFNKPDKLLLTFPNRNIHIFKSLALPLGGSFLFTLIILVTFGITIRVILRQKKISEIKSDFINNMTHEFKTPIATISLAVDSINNTRVINNPDKIRYFTSIIGDENKRMNNSVENVLQMSLIDKGDFNFKLEPIDVHELVKHICKNLALQLEQKNGNISFNLDADEHILTLDRMHLTNVIANLVDNAIKYSEQPEIEISTFNRHHQLHIRIKDNGQGMTREEQTKIFEKFYRVSSGDIHNVKGFGLGLSYVKAIVLAMKGSITVESQPDKGSEFTIVLPVQIQE